VLYYIQQRDAALGGDKDRRRVLQQLMYRWQVFPYLGYVAFFRATCTDCFGLSFGQSRVMDVAVEPAYGMTC